jgi:hypothetical protein
MCVSQQEPWKEKNMSDWNVKKESESNHIFHLGMEILSGGGYKPPQNYVIENTKTGETREVTAVDRDHLGTKIKQGRI